MKKVFFILFTLVTLQVSAQTANVVVRPDSLTTVVRSISTPKTEWLSPFSKVVVDGVEQTNYDNEGAYFVFEDIKGDHKVEVSFIKTTNVVSFYCLCANLM